MQQSKKKPAVIGFTKWNSYADDDIQEHAHDIGTVDEQVRCRPLLRVHRDTNWVAFKPAFSGSEF